MSEVNEEILCLIAEMQVEKIYDVLSDYSSAKRNNFKNWSIQEFSVLTLAEVKPVWESFVVTGEVLNVTALEKIENKVINSINQLYANNLLTGHGTESPDEYYLDYDNVDLEGICEWIEEVSDYGLPKLLDLQMQLIIESNPVNKVMLIDRIFNTVHMRSDLAAIFIKGGSKTLSQLSSISELVEV